RGRRDPPRQRVELRTQRLGADYGPAGGLRHQPPRAHRGDGPERHADGVRHAVRRLQTVGHGPRGRRGRAVAVPRDQDHPAGWGTGAVVRGEGKGALIQASLTAFGGKLRYPSPTSGRRRLAASAVSSFSRWREKDTKT